jgi:hypothetical protein
MSVRRNVSDCAGVRCADIIFNRHVLMCSPLSDEALTPLGSSNTSCCYDLRKDVPMVGWAPAPWGLPERRRTNHDHGAIIDKSTIG